MKLKFTILYILLPLVLISACKPQNTGTVHATHTVDTIQTNPDQLLIDSILKLDNIHYYNSALYDSNLKGKIKSISIQRDKNGLYFPFDYIEYNEDGSINTLKSGDESLGNLSVKVDNEDNRIVIDYDEDICWSSITFDFKEKNRHLIDYDAEGFRLKYYFNYTPNGELKEIIHEETQIHYEAEGTPINKTKEVYNVKIKDTDSKGNWTSIILSNKRNTINLNRHIEYYNENVETPILINFKSDKYIYFAIANYLRYYDRSRGIIYKIIPPEYEDNEVFGFKDYKVFGENLYLIFSTGASGALAYNMECAVYSFNLNNHEWKELGYCGYECEFVGNKIKMPLYNPDTDKQEVEWIEMK